MMSRALAWLAAAALVAAGSGPARAEDAGEKDLRCSVPSDAPLFTRLAGAFAPVSVVGPVAAYHGQPLPSVMVDGWHPAPAPLGAMLSGLGAAAGFKVSGADGFGQVSWTGQTAPLSAVVDSLARQADAGWTFSDGVLSVSRGAGPALVEGSVALPSSRDAALALVDTLRGLDAKSVAIRGSAISFSASPQAVSKINSTLSGVSQVYAFDVAFLEAHPAGGSFAWSKAGGVASGSSFVVFGDDASERLAALLKGSAGDVASDGMQTVSGPAGWALVVPENQCGAGSGEVVLKPHRVGDGFALDIQGAGFSSSVPSVGIGQTLLVAASSPGARGTRLLTIRPRVVSVR